MATEKEIYDYLQDLLPNGLQFVNPYQDKSPTPLKDWAQMNVINVYDRGWSQEREDGYDEDTGLVKVAYDVNRIYSVQFDFYGVGAFDNAREYKQTLEVNIGETDNKLLDLKTMSEITNLSFLEEHKLYKRRYSFDVDFYAVDTIIKEHHTFDKIKHRNVYIAGSK